MRISFYFPCCIARKVDLIYLRFKRKRKTSFFIGVLLFLLIIYLHINVQSILRNTGIICSSYMVKEDIHAMCAVLKSQGGNGQVLHVRNFSSSSIDFNPLPADLCSELCQQSSVLPDRIICQTRHLSKALVFTLSINHEPKTPQFIIVKMATESIPDDSADGDDDSYWKSLNQDTPLPSREEFLNMLYSIASLSTAVPENNKGLQMLIDSAKKIYRQEKQTLFTHRIFWLLVEDQEFLMTLLLQETGLFPKLYDTCGELYAVEFVQTLAENLLVPSFMKRDEKLLKAIDLVNYVEKLENIWTVPLHLCDVKMPHFGWNDKSEAKFVDVDSVMTENLLLDTIRNVPHCDTDEDCSFFDCSARCDVQAGKCIPVRTNTNLQVVCGKVLLGRGSSALPVLGLLADETNDSPLGEALELCRTNPGMTAPTLLHVLQQAYSRQSA